MTAVGTSKDHIELPKLMPDGGFRVVNENFAVDPQGEDDIIRVGSVAQLIEVLNSVIDGSVREVWFRGQRRRSWPLEPTYFRNTERQEAADLTAEYVADSIHEPVHDLGDLHALLSVVRTVFEHETRNLSDMETLLLAQHYGVTTPLMDWSTSPLIAAWFALEEVANLDPEDPPTLWLLDPQFANTGVPYEIPSRLSDSPGIDIEIATKALFKNEDTLKHSVTTKDFPLALYSHSDFSPRIGRQSGKFTFSGPNRLFRNVASGSATLDGGKRAFAPILLAADEAKNMLEELRLLGINELTVYGPRDLDTAVAKELERKGLTKDGRGILV